MKKIFRKKNINPIKLKRLLIFIIVAAICNAVAFCVIHNKVRYHIDEAWTYGLSNSYDSPHLYDMEVKEDTEFFNHWHSGNVFHDYLTVQKNEQFAYNKIFYNQKYDVHPPLYHLVIHTICSFFPDTLSKWYAASVNIVFYILSAFLLFLLAQKITKSQTKAFLATLLWMLARAGISNVAFLRMYTMMTFFTLLFVYLGIRYIENKKVNYLAGILIIQTCAFLTHYYSLIVAFFATAFICFYFLYKKNYRNMIFYALSSLLSVLLAYCIFPSMLFDITTGKYSLGSSETVINPITYFFKGFYYPICVFLQDYGGFNMFSKIDILSVALVFIVFIIMLLNIFYFSACANKKNLKLFAFCKEELIHKGIPYTMICFITILSCFTIGAVCPYLGGYTDRYFFHITPFFAIIIIDYLFSFGKRILKVTNKTYLRNAIAVVSAIIIICSNTLSVNYFLGNTDNAKNIDATVYNKNCYYISSTPYGIHLFALLFQNTQNVYATTSIDENLIQELSANIYNDKNVYLIIEKKGFNKTKIESTLNTATNFSYQFMNSFHYEEDAYEYNKYYLYEIQYH